MKNRRALFTDIFRQYTDQLAVNTPAPPTSILPYTGEWSYKQAAHLLRRTTFGPSNANIVEAVSLGLEGTLSKLFDVPTTTEGPIHSGFNANQILHEVFDPYTEIGAPWATKIDGKWRVSAYDYNTPKSPGQNRFARRFGLRSWLYKGIMTEGICIQQKMTLFWHNHFATSQSLEAIHEFRYFITLRDNALGNFRELVKKITIDPHMLWYLSGNQNSIGAPNQNYARELLELFSIGKGPLIAPGDYSNYTEDDILAASKVLTGWRTRSPENLPIVDGCYLAENEDLSFFVYASHDTSEKVFSAHFQNVFIPDAGEIEYQILIDIIFQKPECAKFICRKLYRWFVYYQIDEQTEANIITPLSLLLIENDYNVQPVIQTLLRSEHFFELSVQGPIIKNPIDFVMSIVKPFNFHELAPAENLLESQRFFLFAIPSLQEMQMEYFNVPDVAGWKAYYQEPSFYRIWINSATMTARFRFVDKMVFSLGNNDQPLIHGLNVLSLLSIVSEPTNAPILIDDICRMFLTRELEQPQKDYLKSILLPSLPDYEWDIEYSDYASDPTNLLLEGAIVTRLQSLIQAIMNMPEFQLS